MKKLISPLILFLLLGVQLSGQKVTVKAGDDLDFAMSSSRYLFPQFEDARVFLKNEATTAKMNYNALTGQMDFINDDGEIVTLSSNAQLILFGKRAFKNTPKGYVEVISDNPGLSELLLHKRYKATGNKRTSAYGMPDETSSLGSFYSVHVNQGISLNLNEEVTYTVTDTYYIFAAGKYLLANKAGFTKAFGKQRPGLDKYLKEEPVNFSKQEDLIRLYTFCIQE